MTPAELHTAALAAIAERRAFAARLREVAEKATPGLWFAYRGPGGYPNSVRTAVGNKRGAEDGLPVLFDGSGVTIGSAHYMRGDDADHVAAFDPPTVLALLDAFDRDTDALESVLERHAPCPLLALADNCSDRWGELCCRTCPPEGWACSCQAESDDPCYWLDCPDAAAVLRALGVTDERSEG